MDADSLRARRGQAERWRFVSGLQTRVAVIEDPRSLDRAFSGAAAVINCAGPFLIPPPPSSKRPCVRVHYFDVVAEQGAAVDVFSDSRPGA
jgi:hypothetical protein